LNKWGNGLLEDAPIPVAIKVKLIITGVVKNVGNDESVKTTGISP